MSAFVVSKIHIDVMVQGIMNGTSDGVVPPLDRSKDVVGQMLVRECVASVSCRYPGDNVEKGELPGPCDPYYLKTYIWEDPVYRPTYLELYKAIACYQYQSCEHPGWEKSIVCRLCELTVKFIDKRIGLCKKDHEQDLRYEDASWEWLEEDVIKALKIAVYGNL